jgi:hypothetical protein
MAEDTPAQVVVTRAEWDEFRRLRDFAERLTSMDESERRQVTLSAIIDAARLAVKGEPDA